MLSGFWDLIISSYQVVVIKYSKPNKIELNRQSYFKVRIEFHPTVHTVFWAEIPQWLRHGLRSQDYLSMLYQQRMALHWENREGQHICFQNSLHPEMSPLLTQRHLLNKNYYPTLLTATETWIGLASYYNIQNLAILSFSRALHHPPRLLY